MNQPTESKEQVGHVIGPENTIKEAKDFLRENYKEGCECPACGQTVKLYKRKLNSAMAYGLILLTRCQEQGYFHIEDFLKTQECPSSIRGDIPKLRYFGLIQAMKTTETGGPAKAGYYIVTQKGRDFVDGKLTVPKSVNLYNNKQYGFSEDHVNIKRALGSKFNYNELMGK